MRFGLIANLRRAGALDAIEALRDWAEKNDQDVILCDELKDIVTNHATFQTRDNLASDVDMIVSMGGDGTLLATARAVGNKGTPILGINLGSLGFLTQQTPQQLLVALDAILSNEFKIEERMVLKSVVTNNTDIVLPCALNDVVIANGPVSRVVNITLRVNNEDVVTYTADGLVLSTPTGSTAYSLAVGGPIVTPGMNAIIAAAIAPFSLTTRPMIFSGDDKLEVVVHTDGRPAVLTIDGQVMIDLKDDQPVAITKAEYRTKFVIFPSNSYYKLLRSKLNWGVPPRG